MCGLPQRRGAGASLSRHVPGRPHARVVGWFGVPPLGGPLKRRSSKPELLQIQELTKPRLPFPRTPPYFSLMKTKSIPEGFHAVTPYLTVKNAAEAIDFYKRAFDAQERMRMPMPGGKVGHAEL